MSFVQRYDLTLLGGLRKWGKQKWLIKNNFFGVKQWPFGNNMFQQNVVCKIRVCVDNY